MPENLLNPVSTLTGKTPSMKPVTNWYFKLRDYEQLMKEWIEELKKRKNIRPVVFPFSVSIRQTSSQSESAENSTVKEGFLMDLLYWYGLNLSGHLFHLLRHISNNQEETVKNGKTTGAAKIQIFISLSVRTIYISMALPNLLCGWHNRNQKKKLQILLMVNYRCRLSLPIIIYFSLTKKHQVQVM